MEGVNQFEQRALAAERVILFGASGLGQTFARDYPGDLNIVGFVDNDQDKAGTELAGIRVYSFAHMLDLNPDFIVVTSQYYEQILNQLAGLDIPVCHASDLLEERQNPWRTRGHFYAFKVLYRMAKWMFGLSARPAGFLHIMPKGGFAESFSRLMSSSNHQQHRFILRTSGDMHESHSQQDKHVPVVSYEKGHWYPSRVADVFKFARAVAGASHVVVHGYFNVARFPFILDSELNRSACWVAWGRDIHAVPARGGFIERRIQASKGAFPYLVTFMKYDFVHAQKRFASRAQNFIGFYPNPLNPDDLTETHLNNEKIQIMVGHSAVDEMHHLSVIKAMAAENNQYRLIAPLSYGNEPYAEKVAKIGAALFEDFVALRQFMAPREYAQWLSTINVAVMHTHTQIALSTMYALVYTGATLYINRQNSSLWSHFSERYKINVFDSNLLLSGQQVQLLSDAQREQNRENARRFFDQQWIARQWTDIFDEIDG